MADEIRWLTPSELANAPEWSDDEKARSVAAQIAFPKALDRELRSHHLETFFGDDESAVRRRCVEAFVAAADRAALEIGDEPGFDEKALLKLVMGRTSVEEWGAVLGCHLVAKALFHEKVRSALVLGYGSIHDVRDVVHAIVGAAGDTAMELAAKDGAS